MRLIHSDWTSLCVGDEVGTSVNLRLFFGIIFQKTKKLNIAWYNKNPFVIANMFFLIVSSNFVAKF